ncbi:LPS-assembly protein LptD [Sphingomonas sinipercae]|uniref:LPS-assembly protein LptD n=1 Tax=Sphingomonas sinipercae TaxID=2714944 RepID=UPI001FE2A8BE|nr:LPS assembly protein LptD [Sphingomonas sinipercae]
MRSRLVWWAALPLLLAPLSGAHAQGVGAPASPAPAEEAVEFSADQLTYDSQNDVVTATGQVRMSREGNYLAADRVVWTRSTGQVRAEGNVVIVNPTGDKLVGENVALSDTLRDGTIDNLLVALEGGGRIAAERGTRNGDVTTLENAAYSACPVTSATGCSRRPSWVITAARVIHDPATNRVLFRGGRLQLFGLTLPLLPIFSVSSDGSGATGFLPPDLKISRKNGFEVALPYFWRVAPNRDLTITPHLYTGTLPAIEAKYRQLNELGAFQVGGFLTYGTIESSDFASLAPGERERGLRGYIEANGRAQLDPLWTVTGYLRAASDKTVTRRYDITRDDRLRNFVNAERIAPDSYVSIAGWAFQGLRVDDVQKQFPIALPAIDARLRLTPPILGGKVELQANSLAILRVDGQDTQRAFASAQWTLRRLTPLGQQLTLTAFGRGDAYHTNDAEETVVPIYRGTNGWHVRGIGALAADLQWPLIGPLLGGIQRVTPRVQIVATPPTPNLAIPNEDARSVDLEDSNLFALNRFPGYDRWEDGSRVTYGVDWMYDRPSLSISSTIGQSYRITRRAGIFPEGTGLTDRLSDVVGRTSIRYGTFVDLTHRFRLDKDNLAVRRNELDLTVGSSETYVQIGYLRLNRDISETVEDLRDKEELRLAGRVKFARYWSVFGATVLDLTDKDEDPFSLADGFEPVRNRLGISYEDDCLELGVTWRRDYERLGEFRKGNTFALQIALKGLGR